MKTNPYELMEYGNVTSGKGFLGDHLWLERESVDRPNLFVMGLDRFEWSITTLFASECIYYAIDDL